MSFKNTPAPKTTKEQYHRAYEIHRIMTNDPNLSYEYGMDLEHVLSQMDEKIVNKAFESCYNKFLAPDNFKNATWLNHRREYDFRQGIKFIRIYSTKYACHFPHSFHENI